ncbi:MAG: bifunctional oligoribonuclease/PAP phosphatase NrnA [Rickettsiales bacterium]|jgi:phosphoesterase RecJ-like protein|nr:bifunctional oligoribonuclease/PAP phosphatase NrnA [Rickettsiales bacterium]
MMKGQVMELAAKIRAVNSILIFGHKNPDGDSLGSALGLRALIADNFGKFSDIIYDGNLPINYDFMPGRGDFVFAAKAELKKYDLVICVDIASKNMNQFSDIQRDFFDAASDSVKIDHHRTNEDFAALNITYPDFTSAAEIVYELARVGDWRVSADAATCLFTGVYSDTGGFAFTGTSAALRVGAELVDMGADPREISENLMLHTRVDFMAQAAVIESAEFFHNGKLCVAIVPNALYKKLDSGEVSMVMKLRNLVGVRVLAVLKEAHDNEIRVSFRSNYDVSVREVAESFGGGGHNQAAAANFNTDAESAKKQIVAAFNKILG